MKIKKFIVIINNFGQIKAFNLQNNNTIFIKFFLKLIGHLIWGLDEYGNRPPTLVVKDFILL